MAYNSWTAGRWVILALPLAFIVIWFLIPLAEILQLSFSDPRGPLAPYQELLFGPGYQAIFIRTFLVAFNVAALSTTLAYPLAYLLLRTRGVVRAIAIWCVLFPFWLSVLARTFAWMLVLDRQGLLNTILLSLGFVKEPLSLLFSAFAVHLGMVHVMLPIAVFPLLAGMANIDDRLLMASAGLGATRLRSFFTIYWPLSIPALISAFTLTFLISLGFFITPAMLGGLKQVTLSLLVENFLNERVAIHMASATAIVLLVATLVVLAVLTLLLPRQLRGGAR